MAAPRPRTAILRSDSSTIWSFVSLSLLMIANSTRSPTAASSEAWGGGGLGFATPGGRGGDSLASPRTLAFGPIAHSASGQKAALLAPMSTYRPLFTTSRMVPVTFSPTRKRKSYLSSDRSSSA